MAAIILTVFCARKPKVGNSEFGRCLYVDICFHSLNNYFIDYLFWQGKKNGAFFFQILRIRDWEDIKNIHFGIQKTDIYSTLNKSSGLRCFLRALIWEIFKCNSSFPVLLSLHA